MAASKKKRKSGVFAGALLLMLALLLGVLLMDQRERIKTAKQQEAELSTKIEQTRQENAELEAALEKKDDEEYLQELARTELGMVAPGEKVFHDVSN